MDQEYEVESVTRARVDAKRGKKITWKYYVKWKGYDWNESTWEPTDSFQGGSEHILETFWERIDTGGRDISDAAAFKRGEELFISGPPNRKGLKKKASSTKIQVSASSNDVPNSNGVTISAPPLASRKRRQQVTVDDEYSKPKQKESAGDLKSEETSARSAKRRRVSSPGPRKSAPKRMPSAGDSQLDADGETDPDMVEVEDELMQVSPEVAEDVTRTRQPTASGSKKISFEDLEHFYSGNPIDIGHNTDDQVAIAKPDSRSHPPLATSPLPDDTISAAQAHVSPSVGSPNSLFDSPPGKASRVQRNRSLPHHRARAANPRVKLIDTTTVETTSKQSRITAKARLMSTHSGDVPSSSRNTAKRGRKPGPDRSSFGLITKNQSSLLTATKGTLKSVKGKFSGTSTERDQPDEIEEIAPGTAEGNKLVVTSWSDEDVVIDQALHAGSSSQSAPPPSGDELLKLAGLQAQTLPDYEDDVPTQPQEATQMTQSPSLTSAPAEQELPDQSLVEEGPKASADSSPPVTETASTLVVTDAAPPVDEAKKKNIELAKEHLFPSNQTSFDSFRAAQTSFRSTIFGPLYQGSLANHMPAAQTEMFKVFLGDGVELPLVLKDRGEIKERINDIVIGHSSGSKKAVFYSAEDALAMANAFKSDGTARVALDPSASAIQQECFSTLLQQFESSQTLVAPVGEKICVLYLSENADIAEKLNAPAHLRGLSRTLLISHTSIEDQQVFVAAVMKATTGC